MELAAWCQTKWEQAVTICHRLRRRVLIPLAHWGSRDMVLLSNGIWIDKSSWEVALPPGATWIYYAERQHLVAVALPSNAQGEVRMKRWPWLGVTSGTLDMTPFFTDLRIVDGATLPTAKAIQLFIHQTGSVPVDPLTITLRNGEEITMTAEGLTVPASDSTETVSEINYVR